MKLITLINQLASLFSSKPADRQENEAWARDKGPAPGPARPAAARKGVNA